MEQSIQRLVVEDEEIDDPAIVNVSKNRPIPKVSLWPYPSVCVL